MSRLVTERTFLAGKIIFNYGQSTIDCVVRRLSEEAATLEMQSGLGVPDQFQLRLAGRDILSCRVIWRRTARSGSPSNSRTLSIARPATSKGARRTR